MYLSYFLDGNNVYMQDFRGFVNHYENNIDFLKKSRIIVIKDGDNCMCSKNESIDILKEVCVLSKDIYSIKDAYLYGSYARGDFNENSDVDILLTVDATVDEISHRRFDIAKITSSLSLKHDITVSVTVKPYTQFEKYKSVLPFYMNVISEGVRYAV